MTATKTGLIVCYVDAKPIALIFSFLHHWGWGKPFFRTNTPVVEIEQARGAEIEATRQWCKEHRKSFLILDLVVREG